MVVYVYSQFNLNTAENYRDPMMRSNRILLVEPDYYTRFPPLGLLKLSSYHKFLGDKTELVRGCVRPSMKPDKIYITSLFTWAWRPVHNAVAFYKRMFPDVPVWLGGVYASLLPDHAKLSGADYIHVGLFEEAESFTPDYTLIPEWKSNILFASRGCIRKCGFCSVPRLEGNINNLKYSIKHLIRRDFRKIVFFDNNILATPNWSQIFDELIELGLEVDFNQGMDVRCVTDEVAKKLTKMKIPMIRLAYDYIGIRNSVHKAIEILKSNGIKGRRLVFYVLFNYIETPNQFFQKVRDLLDWGVVAYPMRYEPLNTLEKGRFISPKWDTLRLDMVGRARRVIGFGGSFPPYKALVRKFDMAEDFDQAFALRPIIKNNKGLLKEGLIEMAIEHEIPLSVRNKDYFPSWRREKDWRMI